MQMNLGIEKWKLCRGANLQDRCRFFIYKLISFPRLWYKHDRWQLFLWIHNSNILQQAFPLFCLDGADTKFAIWIETSQQIDPEVTEITDSIKQYDSSTLLCTSFLSTVVDIICDWGLLLFTLRASPCWCLMRRRRRSTCAKFSEAAPEKKKLQRCRCHQTPKD